MHLLKEFLFDEGNLPQDLDISDPMGQEDRAYQECAQTIDQALDKVVKIL